MQKLPKSPLFIQQTLGMGSIEHKGEGNHPKNFPEMGHELVDRRK
jgi:hypothetical protein